MPLVDVTIRYLEMTSPAQLRAKLSARDDLRIAHIHPAMPELNRFFYTAVGGDWFWCDRLPWDLTRWLAYLNQTGVETWMLTAGGSPAGYFELDATRAGDVEIAYFGLLSRFLGQGLGAHLLTTAVQRGWELGARRVWLHTCTLDHASALTNYLARGFQVFREETESRELPDQTPGPWPGARPSAEGSSVESSPAQN